MKAVVEQVAREFRTSVEKIQGILQSRRECPISDDEIQVSNKTYYEEALSTEPTEYEAGVRAVEMFCDDYNIRGEFEARHLCSIITFFRMSL